MCPGPLCCGIWSGQTAGHIYATRIRLYQTYTLRSWVWSQARSNHWGPQGPLFFGFDSVETWYTGSWSLRGDGPPSLSLQVSASWHQVWQRYEPAKFVQFKYLNIVALSILRVKGPISGQCLGPGSWDLKGSFLGAQGPTYLNIRPIKDLFSLLASDWLKTW